MNALFVPESSEVTVRGNYLVSLYGLLARHETEWDEALRETACAVREKLYACLTIDEMERIEQDLRVKTGTTHSGFGRPERL